MSKEHALETFYFNLENPAAFGGPKALYKTLQNTDISYKYSFGYIKRWLQKQDFYSLHRPVRRRFKTAKVIVGGINDQWDIDLADVQNLSKYNDGVRYLLFIIDIFSRFLRVIPLKNKTARQIVSALKTVFSNDIKVNKIRTDLGSEFYNEYVRAYLKELNVKYFTTNNPPKTNYIERVSAHLKKNFTVISHTRDLIDI